MVRGMIAVAPHHRHPHWVVWRGMSTHWVNRGKGLHRHLPDLLPRRANGRMMPASPGVTSLLHDSTAAAAESKGLTLRVGSRARACVASNSLSWTWNTKCPSVTEGGVVLALYCAAMLH